ncbi:MAG: hypothetical protein ACOY0R_13640 [Chloroflexota bacterium]
MSKSTRPQALNILKAAILPILMAVFPAIFLYGNNVTLLLLPTLGRTILLYTVLALFFFGITHLIFGGQTVKAANAAFIYLIFFNTYGMGFEFLVAKDWFRVDHFTLLPFFLFLAMYGIWAVSRVNAVAFWKGAVIVTGLLVAFNVMKIIPAEIEKHAVQRKQEAPSSTNAEVGTEYPDIYYIIFDEFAGFDVMRSYWNYQGVDDFVDFAKSNGFLVAENSRSSSSMTLHQLSERLNYEEFPSDEKYFNMYYAAIRNNKVMSYLKSKGYMTLAFEETGYFVEALPRIEADYVYEYSASSSMDIGLLFDDFGSHVADNTMLRIFSNSYRTIDPTMNQHRDWILFTTAKMGDLDDVPSPKFVYVHLLLPHMPFMFDENGKVLDQSLYYNWQYYLGNYKYSIKVAERMIQNIRSNSDPHNPPIIIIQSDHGARNIEVWQPGNQLLRDYPEEYSYHILNMMHAPGLDPAQFPQDMNPINTFPIVFNHLFDDHIPLHK